MRKNNNIDGFRQKGFTLIELLIVMAILGVLAVVVLVAINPVQQLARTRDAGRKSAVTQLGHALEAYYTSHGGTYLDSAGNCVYGSANWADCLQTAGEIGSVPGLIQNSLSSYCTTSGWGLDPSNHNGVCYDHTANADAAIVLSALESDSEISKCTTATAAWFIYSTNDGRGGLVCSNTQPTCCSVSFNAVQ